MTTTYNRRRDNNPASLAGAAALSPRATLNAAIFLTTAAILISLSTLPARAANEGSQPRSIPAIDIKRATQSVPVSATAAPVLDIEFASSVIPLSSTATALAPSTSAAFFATAPLASAPPATGTSSPATSTQSASASGSATSTATPSLYQRIYEETFKKCMTSEISEDIMDYLIKHFDIVQDGFQNETIERTVGCLALEREDEKVCDKFNLLPENSKNTFPYETHIESCKDKVATFKVMKDAFTGKDCKKKMVAYCARIEVCKRPGGDGKICTCPLYAVLKCDIPTCDTVKECNGLKPKVEAVLSGQSAAVIDKHAQAVIALCQKAVLGMNPMENERDIGSSVSLFFGGLYSGATWPVFSKDANPEKFGLPQEYAYWYDYVRKHNTTCLKHLDIFREAFCSPYSMSAAREQEEAALKKEKEEKGANKKNETSPAPAAGAETKKDNK